MTRQEILELLSREVQPVMGCTEPVCVALAAADARQAIDGRIQQIQIDVCASIYKNAAAVGIPGLSKTGVSYAAALGAAIGSKDSGLRLFEKVTDEVRAAALSLVDARQVKVNILYDVSDLYVKACVTTEIGVGVSVIQHSHANIIRTERNGQILFERPACAQSGDNLLQKLSEQPLCTLRELVEEMTLAELSFLLEGVEMNQRVADIGLAGNTGIGITRVLCATNAPDTLQNRIALRTAACAESRMSGISCPIMTSAGSGNHGIALIIPIAETAKQIGADAQTLVRALAFGHLLNLYIKHFTGKLSPVCGCAVSAATAASAAMVWMQGGTDKQIAMAIINMVGNLTGMICDGGKVGCALKLWTAENAAYLSACLALEEIVISENDGIVCAQAEETIRNMALVSREGLSKADEVILNILSSKGM